MAKWNFQSREEIIKEILKYWEKTIERVNVQVNEIDVSSPDKSCKSNSKAKAWITALMWFSMYIDEIFKTIFIDVGT